MIKNPSANQNNLRLLVAEAFACTGLSPDQEAAFEKDQAHIDYREALQNYADALWRWVELKTPKSTFEALGAARFNLPDTPDCRKNIEIAKLRYLLRRATYADGLKHGEGWNPQHARFLAGFDYQARLLGDEALFEIATHRRFRRRKAEPINRTLKHQLLIAWLSAGLWRMESREKQWEGLAKMGWPRGKFTEHSLIMAQTRLGLRWFKPRLHKSTRSL
jgi:hypothetical protein